MDPKTITSSNHHLKPPPSSAHHRQRERERTSTTSSASSTPTSTTPAGTTSSAQSRPSLYISKTATVADSAVLHGTHPISIGTGTVIHPRARLYSYEGPINIGDGCIISEKCVIGGSSAPLPTPSMLMSKDDASNPSSSSSDTTPTTHISNAVTIAPLATILPGSYVHSTAVIESLAVVGRNASIGSHSKVCAGCDIPDEVVIGEWTVVWGSGSGFGQRRRKRTVGFGKVGPESGSGSGLPVSVPEARVVEDARMIVLQKEREALVRMLAVSAGGASKRR